MTDYHMRDAASLDRVTSLELHQCHIWAGYLCGEATNVWSDNDWRRVASFPKLPIVVSRTNKTGTFCGLEAIMAIYKLGIPPGTAVAADVELLSHDIAALIEWLDEFNKVMRFFNYYVWPYGSTSYLFDLPVLDGYWVATDSKVQEQYHHPGVRATQYLFDDIWDSSLIRHHAVHSRLTENWGINHH